MCHRAYVLENGRVVLEGTGQALMANQAARARAYLEDGLLLLDHLDAEQVLDRDDALVRLASRDDIDDLRVARAVDELRARRVPASRFLSVRPLGAEHRDPHRRSLAICVTILFVLSIASSLSVPKYADASSK